MVLGVVNKGGDDATFAFLGLVAVGIKLVADILCVIVVVGDFGELVSVVVGVAFVAVVIGVVCCGDFADAVVVCIVAVGDGFVGVVDGC